MMEESGGNGHVVRNIIKMSEEIDSLVDRKLAHLWERDFGLPLDELIRNYECVVPFADHHDPEYRISALCFLKKYRTSAAETRALLMQKARADPCETVRMCAVTNLADVRDATDDKSILELLKSIVYDEREKDSVRKAAYFVITCGVDRHNNLMLRNLFRFPEEVDWDYLDSLVPAD